MRGNSSALLVVSLDLVSNLLLLNWRPWLIRSCDHYLGACCMVMAQGSAKNDAAESANLHQLLTQSPLLNEQKVADLQASLADQLQDLRAGRSRNCEMVLG